MRDIHAQSVPGKADKGGVHQPDGHGGYTCKIEEQPYHKQEKENCGEQEEKEYRQPGQHGNNQIVR